MVPNRSAVSTGWGRHFSFELSLKMGMIIVAISSPRPGRRDI
jgi:hypothetical protein